MFSVVVGGGATQHKRKQIRYSAASIKTYVCGIWPTKAKKKNKTRKVTNG
jgi:hypothetical protein